MIVFFRFRTGARRTQLGRNHRSGNRRSAKRIAQKPEKTSGTCTVYVITVWPKSIKRNNPQTKKAVFDHLWKGG